MSETFTYQEMLATTGLSGGNLAYLEELYEQYLQDPQQLSGEWRDYFNHLPRTTSDQEYALEPIRQHFLHLAKQPSAAVIVQGDTGLQLKQTKVNEYINAYRTFGHLQANIDPLNLLPRNAITELDLSFYGLSADRQQNFTTDIPGLATATLEKIQHVLQQTYAHTITAEFMYITASAPRIWLQQQMETLQGNPQFSKEEKQRILQKLIATEGLERYLGTKFVGQKRFSIEGADSTIPMLDTLLTLAAKDEVKEIVLGMAHRGRLNVLINVNGKPAEKLFDDFAGKNDIDGSGDVKYHKGYAANVQTPHGIIHVSMAYNPSHLEIIAPVVEGMVHAKQLSYAENSTNQVIPVILHGDAAFEGQGVVMETLQLAKIKGYANGGTIHIIINNQVGFTTSPCDDRSTRYATDIAKMFEIPVLRVNGDDPEVCVAAMQIAFAYRKQFQQDILIDLICYRRHGHNESDEPSGTQPLMYKVINALPTTMTLYAKLLEQMQLLDQAMLKTWQEEYRNNLDTGKAVVTTVANLAGHVTVDWAPYQGQRLTDNVNTVINQTLIDTVKNAFAIDIEQLNLQAQVKKVILDRVKMLNDELPLDWGCAENLAYASLLLQNHNIRLSGQDAERGTFSHRHAVVHQMESGEKHYLLNHIAAKQARFEIFNSILSEEAAMAFEYGYSLETPNDLIIWEAQFGDFANGAQVVIDQFLSAGEQKWAILSALVLLLPHGQEGMGPEHSSARLERYLQLCAEDNMQVCMPTTPAQIFHLLRRQVLSNARKPLVVMTPKSLLRHKLATSSLTDLTSGEFQLLIPEIDPIDDAKVERLIICSGKVYYELLQLRRDKNLNHIAIIRPEQLYPFTSKALEQQILRYAHAKTIIWCQEEPKNQGSWYCLQEMLQTVLLSNQQLQYAGRPAAAAPATGIPGNFKASQQQLLDDALGITN